MYGYKVEQHGRRVMLPAAENLDFGQQFSTFAADETVESFICASRSGRLGHRERVRVGLIHRFDNTYNPNAISVVIPADKGGSVDERHLGFLYDDDLREIGSGRLPALIWYAGGEVGCWALVDDEAGLDLDLPEFGVLGSAIGEFLCSRGVVPDRIAPQAILKTNETLDLLHSHSRPRGTIGGVDISMAYSFNIDAWTLDLHESTTGQHLGTVQDATLFLVDERDRHAVLRHLAAQDIPVRLPIPSPPETIPGSWPLGQIPSVRTEWDQGAIRLGCASAPKDDEAQEFAVFNSRTGVLWVEDRRLVDVASLFVSRLALDVRRVRIPQDPWGMDRELGWEDLYGPEAEELSIDSIDGRAKPQLLPQQHQTIPSGILTRLVTFSGVPDPAAAQAGDAWFTVPYRFDPSRHRLFPERTLLGSSAPCRLCGAVALVFTTPISADELRYCHTCLRHATFGLEGTLQQAARALSVNIE